MSDIQTPKDAFMKDVANHKMEIIRDDGVFRHIRFGKPGTIVASFDLITWPGRLCICGDMGTYVFRRLHDMFEFFRRSDCRINEGYWAEKVEAVDRHGGITEFSPEVAREAVMAYLEDGDGITDSIREAVDDEIMNRLDDGEFQFRQAVEEFEHDGFRFYDFWERDLTEYTYHFLWCCHAIAWGVNRYDEQQLKRKG